MDGDISYKSRPNSKHFLFLSKNNYTKAKLPYSVWTSIPFLLRRKTTTPATSQGRRSKRSDIKPRLSRSDSHWLNRSILNRSMRNSYSITAVSRPHLWFKDTSSHSVTAVSQLHPCSKDTSRRQMKVENQPSTTEDAHTDELHPRELRWSMCVYGSKPTSLSRGKL